MPDLRVEALRFSTAIRAGEDWELYLAPRVPRYVVARMLGMTKPETAEAQVVEVEMVFTPGEARRAGRVLMAAARRARRKKRQ